MRRLDQTRRRLRSEDGIALPVAMLATAIGLAFAGVVVLSSVSVQRGDARDHASETALTGAEAGAELALLRQSRTQPAAGAPCVQEEGGALVYDQPQTDGWCPPVGPRSVGNSSVTYQVRPCYAGSDCYSGPESTVTVVATGSTALAGRTVTRRIQTTATAGTASSSSTDVFAAGQIIGIDRLTMHDDAKIYNGGAGSNGEVTLTGGANVCGTVGYGTDYEASSNGSDEPPPAWWPCPAGRTFVKGTVEYPPVAVPEDWESNNSNWRLSGADPSSASSRGNISWNFSNKELTLKYNWLRLEGTAPYVLCQLHLAGGGTLKSGAGRSIKIFLLPPENCPGLNGTKQLVMDNGTHVEADSANGPGFYLVGDSNPSRSEVSLQGGSSSQQFVVYAPHSEIDIANGITHNGAIIGRTMDIGGGARINQNKVFDPPPSDDFTESTEEEATSFSRRSFVECTATGGATPDAGC